MMQREDKKLIEEHTDFQDVLERHYAEQWGNRRFYLASAIFLLIVAILSAAVIPLAENKSILTLSKNALTAVQLSALTTGFVTLVAGVMMALGSLIRWQREKGQFPDSWIHISLCLSALTVASIGYLYYLHATSWDRSPIKGMISNVEFIVILFGGLVWLSSVIISSMAITMLFTRKSDLLEVSNSMDSTSLVFKKGHTTEIVKLSVAVLIQIIVYLTVLLMGALSATA